ncbi:exported hypothetical protein [Desulfamplus magnetovallimortis]|uniref:Uncharacterized protein n=1 Tax=Desulfamplus magnetovallimortis TaxID=1246637 RepID=A0A1W1HCQ0_9BACT|nr:exported hypothetical protein [Desulfamplus magnetovallimortis]
MVSLIVILIFLFILAIFYPFALIVLSFGAFFVKIIGRKAVDEEVEKVRIKQIDLATDRIKEHLFTVSVVLIFFIIAPFVVLYFWL